MAVGDYAHLLHRLAEAPTEIDWTKRVIFGPQRKYHPDTTVNIVLCTIPGIPILNEIAALDVEEKSETDEQKKTKEHKDVDKLFLISWPMVPKFYTRLMK
ncbi:unnamed protein product [Gongylonema pulchrum]|uniref:Fe2OG dioxygenase domain-containing protein n=1 Tax=Gongylonema pulchrum TaxID=637853 RepID=A0A183DP32_9BILA|nr:unnamed protein product [Gongylonema pulchrum]